MKNAQNSWKYFVQLFDFGSLLKKVLGFQKDFPNEIIDFGLLWAIFFLVKCRKQFIESKGRNSIWISLRRINRFFVQRSFHDQVDNQRNMSYK